MAALVADHLVKVAAGSSNLQSGCVMIGMVCICGLDEEEVWSFCGHIHRTYVCTFWTCTDLGELPPC